MSTINLSTSHLENCDELLTMLENIYKAEKTESHYVVQRNDLDRLKNARGETLLFIAVKTANVVILKILIEAGADVNAKNESGQTPLVLTLINTDEVHKFRLVVEILCKYNANIYATDKLGRSPVQLVVNQDCYWDFPNYDFVHPLFLDIIHRQCMKDAETTAKKLIDLKYPFWRVIHLGNEKVIEHMIANSSEYKYKYNINSKHPETRFTALHRAVGTMNLKMVKYLIEKGADLGIVDSKKQLPIDYYGSAEIQQPEVIEILLTEALIQLRQQNRLHPLQYVRKGFECGNRKIIRIMFEHFDSKDQIGPRGMFPLHWLARNRHSDVTDELREREIDVNVRDIFGRTPLHCAAECPHSHVNTFQFLLENGADPNARDDNLRSAFDNLCANKLLSREKYREVVDMFLHNGLYFDVYFDEENQTIFEIIANNRTFYMAEPLLEHLAIQDEINKPISERVRNDINSRAEFKSYFEVCKAELAEMKNHVINKKMTLYTIITKQISDEKILKSCSSNLLSKFEALKEELQLNYYHTLMEKRLSTIIFKLELLQKASYIMCILLKLDNDPYYIIVTEILSYLNTKDHQALVELDI